MELSPMGKERDTRYGVAGSSVDMVGTEQVHGE